VEAFAASRGVTNVSLWGKRVSGVIIALAGVWFVWRAF